MTFDPGLLRERVRFDQRVVAEDGLGNREADWDAANGFIRWALYLMRPGSEAVLAARLTGRQPVTIITRFDNQTSAVTAAWRVVDTRTGAIYDIQAAADMDRKREWMSFVCEAGVAA